MNGTRKPGLLLCRMFGAGLALLAFPSQGALTAEPMVRTQTVGVSKGKAVHYIENQPDASGSKPTASRNGVQKIEENKVKPVSEPPPLELKGVRG